MQQTIHDKTLLCDQFNTTEIQTWIAVCSVTFTGHPSLTDRVCVTCLTVPADEPQTTDRSAGIPCQATTRRRGFQDRCRQIRGRLHRDVGIRHDIYRCRYSACDDTQFWRPVCMSCLWLFDCSERPLSVWRLRLWLNESL